MYAAERPFAPASPYDAERALSEMVLAAAAALAGWTSRPAPGPRWTRPRLAPGYSTRQQVTAERAARLLAACDAALADDGASISAYEADRRAASCAGCGHAPATPWPRPSAGAAD